MNILLVGEQADYLSKFKDLLELAFPHAIIKDSDIESSYGLLHVHSNEWNVILFLPDVSGIYKDDLLRICENYMLPVMVIVGQQTKIDYVSLLSRGVKGIIGYDAPLDILRNGLQYVKENGMYFDPQIAKKIDLLSALKDIPKQEIPELTKRQWEIYRLIAKGMTREEIAQILALKPSTILAHQKKIIEITKARTLPGAVAKGFYYGWLKNI